MKLFLISIFSIFIISSNSKGSEGFLDKITSYSDDKKLELVKKRISKLSTTLTYNELKTLIEYYVENSKKTNNTLIELLNDSYKIKSNEDAHDRYVNILFKIVLEKNIDVHVLQQVQPKTYSLELISRMTYRLKDEIDYALKNKRVTRNFLMLNAKGDLDDKIKSLRSSAYLGQNDIFKTIKQKYKKFLKKDSRFLYFDCLVMHRLELADKSKKCFKEIDDPWAVSYITYIDSTQGADINTNLSKYKSIVSKLYGREDNIGNDSHNIGYEALKFRQIVYSKYKNPEALNNIGYEYVPFFLLYLGLETDRKKYNEILQKELIKYKDQFKGKILTGIITGEESGSKVIKFLGRNHPVSMSIVKTNLENIQKGL